MVDSLIDSNHDNQLDDYQYWTNNIPQKFPGHWGVQYDKTYNYF